jgi:AcrR family transcriptional regulator
MSREERHTRERLLETAVTMLDDVTEKDISAAEILRRTGIARGSLYHFWDSIGELIEEAYLVRFSRFVEASGGVIQQLLDKSTNKEEFLAGLSRVTELTQDPARKANRFERARILGMAEKNEKFRRELGKVQSGLTDLFTQQFQEAQNRGWFNKTFDPRAAAVLIQAYTLGKIVDDVVDNPMNADAWNALIGLIVDKTLTDQ